MAREYGTSAETTASPDKVWRVWSDMSTWGEWNPNVSTMDWSGGFVSGSTGRDSLKIVPVTINQFPTVILNAAMQSAAARRKAAYIVAWRRCFAPT